MTAPGSPHVPVDARPQRPDTIVLGVQLWFAVIVLQIVAVASKFNVLKASSEQQLEDVAKKMNEPSLVNNTTLMVIVTLVLLAVVLSAIAGILMWFTYAGHNWARLLLGWASAFLTVDLAFALVALFSTSTSNSDLPEPPAWGMIPSILGGVCALGALIALMHRDSTAYCRSMSEYRTQRRRNRQQPPPSGPGWPDPNSPVQNLPWRDPNGQNDLR